jgi:hypothetical protein
MTLIFQVWVWVAIIIIFLSALVDFFKAIGDGKIGKGVCFFLIDIAFCVIGLILVLG